jgi:hypothetical protein
MVSAFFLSNVGWIVILGLVLRRTTSVEYARRLAKSYGVKSLSRCKDIPELLELLDQVRPSYASTRFIARELVQAVDDREDPRESKEKRK